MIYTIDIDGTICSDTKGNYSQCLADCKFIDRINEKFKNGDKIIIHTARSAKRRRLTKEQLEDWGVKYHELVMGKPKSDFYVDRHSLKPEDF